MSELVALVEDFRKKRGWDKIDNPANLSKSIVIEAAELLEHFQWSDQDFDVQKVKDELADVLMYAIALCIDLGVEPMDIIKDKLVDVAKRYPEL